MHRLLSRLSYANVMATVAVFLSLGGGAYAVTQIDKNSVRSRQIVNGQVKKADLGERAVRSETIRDGEIRAPDIAAAAVGTKQVGALTRRFTTASVPAGNTSMVQADCESGERAISGGGLWQSSNPNLALSGSFPTPAGDPTGWVVQGANPTAAPTFLTAFALCLRR